MSEFDVEKRKEDERREAERKNEQLPTVTPPSAIDPSSWDAIYFGRALIGIGYAMLVDGILTLTAMACMANNDRLQAVLAKAADNKLVTGKVQAAQIVLMLAFSMFGALFYFANSLWEKSTPPVTERFDIHSFWGGLWFRMGEAVIFALVVFLTVQCGDNKIDACQLLLLALIFGMFLKSAEKVVVGLSEVVFAAFSRLMPTPKDEKKMIPLAVKLKEKPGVPLQPTEMTRIGEALKKALPGIQQWKQGPANNELRLIVDAGSVDKQAVVNQLFIEGYDEAS